MSCGQPRRKAINDRRSNPRRCGNGGIRLAGLCAVGLHIWSSIQDASRRRPTSVRSTAPTFPSSRKRWQLTHPSRRNTSLPRLAHALNARIVQASRQRLTIRIMRSDYTQSSAPGKGPLDNTLSRRLNDPIHQESRKPAKGDFLDMSGGYETLPYISDRERTHAGSGPNACRIGTERMPDRERTHTGRERTHAGSGPNACRIGTERMPDRDRTQNGP